MLNTDVISPLRYPGGKNDLVGYVHSFIYENVLQGSDFIELYAGGASVSLGLLRAQAVKSITLVELDPLVAAFWRAVCRESEQLCKKIENTKVTMKLWQTCRNILFEDDLSNFSNLDLAYAGILLNRTCYSGILHAGPIGGKGQHSQYTLDCRFYKNTLVERIIKIAALKKHITVVQGDAIEFLKKRKPLISGKPNAAIYIDPPYFKMGKRLYRYFYQNDDHSNLATILRSTNTPWLLSYDDHAEIRSLYRSFQTKRFCLRYHVSDSKDGKELLISNSYLPPIERRTSKSQ